MSIKPSASAEIRTLIAALASSDEVKRESAIARLAIIGPRATERIISAYAAADRDARIGMLRALEAMADPRALPLAREALGQGGDVAVAAAGTLRPLLDAPEGSTATKALDALVSAALSPDAERRVRLAALDALRDMPASVREPVERALHMDADAAGAVWADAIEGRLPDDPAGLREALASHGATAPLGVLQKLVEAVRARELTVTAGPRREAWLTLRGALHQALALRGSPIAVYDLRETLAATEGPLPSGFLSALHAVGDESCLAPIAAAVKKTGDERWRQQLEAAFHAIVKRDKLGRTRAARLLDVSTPSRTTPRRSTRSRT